MSISVLGAGAFGTSLAISFASNGPVTLWAHDPNHVAAMETARCNERRLPGVRFPDALAITASLDRASEAETILLALPMQILDGFLAKNANLLRGKALVACCKGIDLETLTGPTARIEARVPDACPAILTGPSFAADIARNLPTALTLACAQEEVGRTLQKSLLAPNLRLYRTTDTLGAELGGALKNVIAIASGIVMGAGLGESARAALITRGFAEMQRFANSLGAQQDTLSGLSGLGDLILTCSSDKSRNYRFGAAIGSKAAFDSSITVEGAATARATLALADQRAIDMPITAAVVTLLDNPEHLEQVIVQLLSRPLKEE